MKKTGLLAFAVLCAVCSAAVAQDYDFVSQARNFHNKAPLRLAPSHVVTRMGHRLACAIDADVPQDIQAQLAQDMSFMETVNGAEASALHKKIFGPVNGVNYVKFFESRVKSIGINGCGSGNAVACVQPYADPSKMWLTQNYIKFSHPQIARLMVVFHESRHTETQNGNWHHATCPTPFVDAQGNEIKSIWTGSSLAGEPACDSTPFGSYGSSMILLKNIQKFCTTCTGKVRMDAGIYADDQFKRIISPKAIAAIKADLY